MRNGVGALNKLAGAGGETNNGVLTQQTAGIGDGQIVLADMYPVDAHPASTQGKGNIHPIINQYLLVGERDARNLFGKGIQVAGADGLGTHLYAGGVPCPPHRFDGVFASDQIQ